MCKCICVGRCTWMCICVSECLCLCSRICGGQRTILGVILQAPSTFLFEIIIALFSAFRILPLTPPTHVSLCLLSYSWPFFLLLFCLFAPKYVNATCSFLTYYLCASHPRMDPLELDSQLVGLFPSGDHFSCSLHSLVAHISLPRAEVLWAFSLPCQHVPWYHHCLGLFR